MASFRFLPALALGLMLALTACGRAHSLDAQISVHDQQQIILNRIADKCGLARSTFKLAGTDELHIMPRPDAKYETVDCALSEIRKTNLPLKMGFIGNEYYVGNEE